MITNSKPITCWYKYNSQTDGFHYNHYEDGFSYQDKPTHKFKSQNIWKDSRWLKEHTFIKNGKIE